MGEEREEEQKLKRIGASSYDYENDPRWTEYWSNILIPPHMAARSDVVEHYKRKFYQRYIDPDLVVEPMSSGSSSMPARPSPSSSSTTTSETHARSPGATRSPPTSAPSLRWDRQTLLFSVNAWVFVVAVLASFPPNTTKSFEQGIPASIYGNFMFLPVFSVLLVWGIIPKPRAWNMQSLQVYLQSVVPSKDFICFIYCLAFVTSHLCLKFALIPVLCRTLEQVAKFLRHNFSRSSLYRKYLEEPCVWVESNTTTLGILSSNAEIGVGFLLIVSLLSWQRNIIQTFMYWQVLKLMYHAPVTAGYHRSTWAKIGRTVNPLMSRYAPFLNTPLSAIQRWWFRQ